LRIEPREVLVSIVAVDKDTRDVISGAAITCLDLAMNTGVNLKPNVNAFEFITNLGKKYEMSGSKAGYFANSIQKTIGYDERSDVLRFEIPLEKIVLDKAIELENIYYDLDKSFIRADAAVELDKLVKILVDNPTIKIELGSHTDSRGSDNYNQRLSQRRATSAVEYIVKNGIDKGRIVAKGYGETALVNKCSNGVQCSKEEHQRNRRTEFKVTSY
jgi:outer membrane protein OmpA-like peptidoglycan-associated protein